MILAIFPSGNIFNTPCVPRLLEVMSKIVPNEIEFLAVRNCLMPSGQINGQLNIRWMPISISRRPENVSVVVVLYGCWAFFRAILKRPRFVLAIGLRGLLIAGIFRVIFGSKIIYNCLELYPPDRNRRGLASLARNLEVYITKRVELIIIQDQSRARLLSNINKLQDAKYSYFPNFPLLPSTQPSDFELSEFRRRLGIPEGKRLILFAGGIYPGIKLSNAVMQLRSLSEDWCMIIQSHDGVSCLEGAEVQELLAARRLFLFLDPLDQSDFWLLLNLIDIGFAWYPPTGNDNMTFVGLSSGKVASYWAAGKPVIINRLPFYEDVLPKYMAGIVVDEHDEIPSAVKDIDGKMNAYSQGARSCYEAFFSSERVETEIRKEVGSLFGLS